MSFEEDFNDDFDDDDDLLALTLKPKGHTTTPPPLPTTTHEEQHDHQEFLQAKGEIAVLRAKIQQLENQQRHERDVLQTEKQKQKTDSESKVLALESLVKRLEDEKKFLSVEVRNLNAHKRRKKQANEQFRREDDDDTQNHSDTNTTTPEPVTPMPHNHQRQRQHPPTTATSTTTSTTSASSIPQTSRPATTSTVRIIAPKQSDDNARLIDSIMTYIIPGSTKTTMEYLSKISLNEPFQSDLLYIPPNEPLNTHILQFLVSQREANRLDEFITKIVKSITGIIRKLLFHSKQEQVDPNRFPVPYLLSLIHCTILYRPKALVKDVLKEMIHLCHDMIKLFAHLLKPQEEINTGGSYERHQRIGITAIQYEFTSQLILVYACDLMESLMITAWEDPKLVKSILDELNDDADGQPFNRFIKLSLNGNSNLLIIAPIVEILSSSLNAFDGDDVFPLLSQDVVNSLVQILREGTSWKANWLFNGLNRLTGNTLDNIHITNLVGDKLKSHPQVIHPIESSNSSIVDNLHQQHLIFIQSNILKLFEKFIITTSLGINCFNSDPSILKALIFTIGKQQEHIFNSPRNNLTHLRSKFISSLIRILHLIWEMTTMGTQTSSPTLTKDTIHELLITLARVAFSNSETSHEASDFLLQVRRRDTHQPVFNKWAEERARQLSHADDDDDGDGDNDDGNSDQPDRVIQLVNAQVGYSNGLEFAYDDDVVELARDILEKCTTMDEADMMYNSMNPTVDRKTDEDEMMIGL